MTKNKKMEIEDLMERVDRLEKQVEVLTQARLLELKTEYNKLQYENVMHCKPSEFLNLLYHPQHCIDIDDNPFAQSCCSIHDYTTKHGCGV